MREVQVEEVVAGGVKFATDKEGRESDSGVNARMYSPGDAIKWGERRSEDLADMLVKRATDVGLRKRPEGGFEIAPRAQILDDKGLISGAIREHGAIPLTDHATDQICKLMGRRNFAQGYAAKMRYPERHFLTDFQSMYGREGQDGLILRTSNSCGLGRRAVEGVIPEGAPRVDENKMLRIAMGAIMRAVGGECRGVEFLDDPKHATRSFRLIFGQPNIDRSNHVIDYHGHIYPMMDMTLSATGVVTPSIRVGLYRVLCRNAAIDDMFPLVNWRGTAGMNLESFSRDMRNMAELAVPYCNHLGERLEACFNRKLEGDWDSTIQNLHKAGVLSDSHRNVVETHVKNRAGELANAETDSEWALFNCLTDAAKQLNPLQSRRKAEHRALSCLIAGGMDAVCKTGLDIRANRKAMVEAMKVHPEVGQVMTLHETRREEMTRRAQDN